MGGDSYGSHQTQEVVEVKHTDEVPGIMESKRNRVNMGALPYHHPTGYQRKGTGQG